MFVQVAIPHWVASLLENAKLPVGDQSMRLIESANPFCPDHGQTGSNPKVRLADQPGVKSRGALARYG
jgi:hypothetical protein